MSLGASLSTRTLDQDVRWKLGRSSFLRHPAVQPRRLVSNRRRHFGYVGKMAAFKRVGKIVYNNLIAFDRIVMNGFLHASFALLSIYTRCYLPAIQFHRIERMDSYLGEPVFRTGPLAKTYAESWAGALFSGIPPSSP